MRSESSRPLRPAGTRKSWKAAPQVLEAQMTPVPTTLPLPQYVGVYGVRHITNDDGTLVFQREGGPKGTARSRSDRTNSPSSRTRCSA